MSDHRFTAHGRAPRMRTAATTRLAATAALLYAARDAFPDVPVCRGCGQDADHCVCSDGPDTASAGYRAAVEELAYLIADKGGQIGGHLCSPMGRTVLWQAMTDAALEAEVPGYAALVDARQRMEQAAPVVVPMRGCRLVPAEVGQ